MKVLMTADAVGGVWTYALDLARGLGAHGVEIVLCIMGPAPSEDARQAAAEVPGLVLEERPYRLEWMSDCWDDIEAAGQWLRDLEDHHEPDVVHLNGYVHGACAFRAPVVVVGHSCVYGWWEAVHGSSPPEKWRAYREAVRRGLQGADLVVAPTAAMLRTLERHYGPFSTAMVAVPNGRSTFTRGSLAKDPVALWVGRVWDEAKDVALLEEAAGQGLSWPVLVIGDERHPEGRPPRPLNNVRALGRVSHEELKGAYDRAAIFVSTARYEPFGLGPLEAAQAGCALVLPRIESLEETWSDVALFYRPGDAADLRHLLNRLAGDRVLLRRRGEKARQRASSFTEEEMAKAYMVQYRRLTESSRPTTREADACAL